MARASSLARRGMPLVPLTLLLTLGHSRLWAQGPPDCLVYAFTGSLQQFVVPPGVTALDITAEGAGGGFGDASTVVGRGAIIAASVPVTPTETLTVLVGGRGGDTDVITRGGGGGGGTFVYRAPDLAGLLVAAGGGGGGGGAIPPSDGQFGTSGANGGDASAGTPGGTGGQAGLGGQVSTRASPPCSVYCGAGGGGLIGGGGGTSAAGGGQSIASGGAGGASTASAGAGGFGAGGAGGGSADSGGGGGGFSGGGGGGLAAGGGGGGSFNAGTRLSEGLRIGNGTATICYPSELIFADGFDPAAP